MIKKARPGNLGRYVIPARRDEQKKLKEATIVRGNDNERVELRANFVHKDQTSMHNSTGHSSRWCTTGRRATFPNVMHANTFTCTCKERTLDHTRES